MIADPCTAYGINAGCDENCPVLLDGDCVIGYENILEHGLFKNLPEERRDMAELYGVTLPPSYITF